MVLIKNKKQQEILESEWHYKPNKKLQCIQIWHTRKAYTENIIFQLKGLFNLILILLSTPFNIVIQLYRVLKSLRWWCVVITKKNIDDV